MASKTIDVPMSKEDVLYITLIGLEEAAKINRSSILEEAKEIVWNQIKAIKNGKQ